MPSQPVEKPAAPASYADFSEPESGGWVRTLVQFFAIPLLIVLVAVGLYLGISLIVGAGPESAADFVKLLRSDTLNRRWQAAFELSARLRAAEVPAEFHDPALLQALHATLDSARGEGGRQSDLARTVLTILARIGDPASIEPVRRALDDEDDATRSFAILAAGRLGDRAMAPRLRELARHEDAGTRQAALFALAQLDQVEGLPFQLSPETRALALDQLGDPSVEVRFQAALIAARAGDLPAARKTLLLMLDRSYLDQLPFDEADQGTLKGIDRHQVQSNLIIDTIATIAKLRVSGEPELTAALERLADPDREPDLHVRESAREALRQLQTAGRN